MSNPAQPVESDAQRITLARRVASLLTGAWRVDPPALSIVPQELDEVAMYLVHSGAAPLVWRRLRDSNIAGTPTGARLARLYLQHAALGVVQEEQILESVSVLRQAGIEAILAKGWALARYYPEPGLRPSADIDLFVRPADLQGARKALAPKRLEQVAIDLHSGFPDLSGRSVESLFSRSRLVPLGAGEVRLLSSADHLRLVCLHLLRHAGWRPTWFCDVGVLAEQITDPIDWDLFYHGAAWTADWLRVVIALSQELLGIKPVGWIASQSPRPVPTWLTRSVLIHWSRQGDHLWDGVPLAAFLFQPTGVLRALRRRWPSPLEASVMLRMPFNDFPRLPIQILECARRAVFFAGRLPLTLWDMHQLADERARTGTGN